MLAADKPAMTPLRQALRFVHPDTGKRKSPAEKHALIAKAWGHFLAGRKLSSEVDPQQGVSKDLALAYDKEVADDGTVLDMWLDECPVFGGIDAGVAVERKTADDDEPGLTPEESKRRLREAKDREVTESVEKAKKAPKGKKEKTPAEHIADLMSQHPGKTLLFANPATSGWHAYGDQARQVGALCGIEPNASVDPCRLTISRAQSEAALATLAASTLDVVCLRWGGPVGQETMTATLLERAAVEEVVVG